MQVATKKYYFIMYLKESSHIDFNPVVDISIFFNNKNVEDICDFQIKILN